MFTIETKINGNILSLIYGYNTGYVGNNVDKCVYDYNYHDIVEGTVTSGSVKHNRSDGMDKLIQLILKDKEKKESAK